MNNRKSSIIDDCIFPTECAAKAFERIFSSESYSIIKAELHTGRKHQIRAHLASLGHPIVGDRIYSHNGEFYLKLIKDGLNDDDYKKLGARHHLLHSWKSEIQISNNENIQVFESKIWNSDFKKKLSQLNEII